jgi:5-methylcytosine-specific restriction endonuclease McrA
MKGQSIFPKYNIGNPFDTKKKRKPIKPKIRKTVLTKPKKCAYCRKLPAQHIHHIRGVASGGSNRKGNLIGLCGYCHHRVTVGEITNEQLKRRLGIKVSKPKKTKRHRREYNYGIRLPKRLF